MRNRTKGFTLIELMVSVGLMVILIGAVVMVFVNSSKVMRNSDAKSSLYQNARSAYELMSKELSGLQTVEALEIKPEANPPEPFLKFYTITSWINSSSNIGERMEGMAKVEYFAQNLDTSGIAANGKWVLKRKISLKASDGSLVPEANNTILQYIAPYYTPAKVAQLKPAIKLGYFKYDAATTTKWVYDSNQKTFNPNDVYPAAIKIDLDVVDGERSEFRTFSRMVWIATGNN